MTMVRKLLLLLIIVLYIASALTISAGSALLVDSETVASNSFTTGTFEP